MKKITLAMLLAATLLSTQVFAADLVEAVGQPDGIWVDMLPELAMAEPSPGETPPPTAVSSPLMGPVTPAPARPVVPSTPHSTPVADLLPSSTAADDIPPLDLGAAPIFVIRSLL